MLTPSCTNTSLCFLRLNFYDHKVHEGTRRTQRLIEALN